MIIFMDTETTGKAKDFKQKAGRGDNWPRIVQLAYSVYSNQGHHVLDCSNLIKPDGWTITPEALATHGHTLEKCEAEGIPLKDAMIPFMSLHQFCTVMVCHNIQFDYNVAESERLRVGFMYSLQSKPKICTMQETTDIVKIPSKWHRKNKPNYKWPSLQELHKFCFDEEFDGAHDAMADVHATARCFFELIRRGVKFPALHQKAIG